MIKKMLSDDPKERLIIGTLVSSFISIRKHTKGMKSDIHTDKVDVPVSKPVDEPKYKILNKIDEGSFGQVYKCEY